MALTRPVNKTVIVNSEEAYQEALGFLQSAHESGVAHEFSVKLYVPHKSRAQENTWRGLIRVFAEASGNDAEDLHYQMSIKFAPCKDIKRTLRDGSQADARVPLSWKDIDVDEANFAIKQLTIFIIQWVGGASLPGWVLKLHDS